jgi:hypothetical protein
MHRQGFHPREVGRSHPGLLPGGDRLCNPLSYPIIAAEQVAIANNQDCHGINPETILQHPDPRYLEDVGDLSICLSFKQGMNTLKSVFDRMLQLTITNP